MQLVGRVDPGEYMAFGLGKDDAKSDMINSDAVVAWIDDKTKKGFAVDYFLGSKEQCVGGKGACPDVKVSKASSDSITLLHASLVNGFSMITFKRPQLGVDDSLDQHVYSDGQQSINWAIGPLNDRQEVSFHRLHSVGNSFIDFARTPKWNCPSPDGPLPDGSSPATTFSTTTSTTTVSPLNLRGNLIAPPTLSPGLRRSSPTTASSSAVQGWEIPAIICPSDRTFRAQIGPTGGRKGYQAITGKVGWGIAWYINGLLIPELVVQRGKTYTFIVEGGNDPNHSARRHPFYITDNPEGGYDYRTDEERSQQKIFAGAALRSDGQIVPTAEGRLCEWKPTDLKSSNPESFSDFFSFQRSLNLQCLAGKSALIRWTPDSNTPDTVYYQCWTHRLLGWKIRVVDSCENIAASASSSSRVRTTASNSRRNSHENNKNHRISSSEQQQQHPLPQQDYYASLDLMRMNHNHHQRPQQQEQSSHSPVPAGSVVKAVTASSPSTSSSPSFLSVTSAPLTVSSQTIPYGTNVRSSSNVIHGNNHQNQSSRRKNSNRNKQQPNKNKLLNNNSNLFPENAIHFNIQPQLESHWMYATHTGSYEPHLPPPPLHHHLHVSPQSNSNPVMTFEPFFLPSYPLPPLMDDHPPVYIRQKLPPPIPLPKDQPLPSRPSHLSSLTHAHLKVNNRESSSLQKESHSGNEREAGRGNFLGHQPLYGGFVPLIINSRTSSSTPSPVKPKLHQQQISGNHTSRIKHNKVDKNILNVSHTNSSNDNRNKSEKHDKHDSLLHKNLPVTSSFSFPSSTDVSNSNILDSEAHKYNISRYGYPSYTADGTYSGNRISFPPSDSSSSSSVVKVKHTPSITKIKNLPPVPYQRPLDPSYDSSVASKEATSISDSMIAMERDSKMSSSVVRPTHSDEETVFGSRHSSSTRFSSSRNRKKPSTSGSSLRTRDTTSIPTSSSDASSSSFPSSIYYYNTENHESETSSPTPPSSTPSYSSSHGTSTAKAFASYSFSSPSTSYSAMTTTSSPSTSLGLTSTTNGVNEMPSSDKNRRKNSPLRVKAIEIPLTSSFYSPESTSPSTSSFPASSYSYSSPASSSRGTSSSSSYYSSYSSPSLLSSSAFDASSSPTSSSFSFPTTLSDSPASSPFSFLKNHNIKASGSTSDNDNNADSASSSHPMTTSSFMTTMGMKSNRNNKHDNNNNSNNNGRYNEAVGTAGGAILEVIQDESITTMSPITTTIPYSSSLIHSSPVMTPDPDLKHHQGYGSTKKNETSSTYSSGHSIHETGISYNPIYYDGENSINVSSTDHTILNHILSLIAVGESPPEVKVFTKPSRDPMQGAFSTHVEVHQRQPSSSSHPSSQSIFSRSKRSPNHDQDHDHSNDRPHVLRQQKNTSSFSSSSTSSRLSLLLFIPILTIFCSSFLCKRVSSILL